MPTIAAIYRYPVKGLGPDHLESAELAPGHTIAGDRLYAIENGPSGFDPAQPAYLPTAEGRAAIEQFFAAFCADELRGPPKVLHAPGHSFSDVARKVVSIINLASVASLETVIGAAVHPLRFRANLYVRGWPAWAELDLVGREIAIGTSARFKVVKRIVRCAATNVDPDTGVRDLAIPDTLLQNLGHTDCGVYAEVIAGGPIAAGDEVRTEN